MSKLWILTKVLIKSSLSTAQKKKRRSVPPFILLLLLLIIFASSFSFPLGAMFLSMYNVLAPINQQGVILTLAIASVSVVTLVLGIFYVLTVFYFAKDVELLLPLPLSPSEILGAKFISVLIYEYLTELVLLTPAIVVYGVKSNASVVYYLLSLLVFLVVPVIPLIIASIINMVVMRFTNIGKHKDALRIIGGLIALAFGLGINILMQRLASFGTEPDKLLEMLTKGDNSLVGMMSKVFPSAKLASISLIYSTELRGIVNLLLFIAVSLIFVMLFFILAEVLYFKGALGNSEVYSKRQKLSKDQMEKSTRQNSIIKAYTLKELKILFRTPAFLMNCVIINFLWPVFFSIGAFSAGSSGEIKIDDIINFIKQPKALGIAMAAVFAMSLFVSGSNGIASTSLSREGQNIFTSKYLPIKFRDQVIGRIIPAIILSLLPVIIAIIAVSVLVRFSADIIIAACILAVLGTILTSLLGILLDIKFPKLSWDNEQKAVKQNINLIVVMFGSWALAALVIYLVVKFKFTLWYSFMSIAGISLVINVILYYIVMTIGEKWFNKIEA